MEEGIYRELETIKGMVLTWKKSYLRWAPPTGDREYLVREFLEEIETHVYPYVRRLYECNYLSDAELDEFMMFCYSQVNDLRNALQVTGLEWLGEGSARQGTKGEGGYA